MEVRVAASGTHKAVSLYLGTHKLHIFSRNIRRPVIANPAQLADYSWWNDHFAQSAANEYSLIHEFLTHK